MNQSLSIKEITERLADAAAAYTGYCNTLPEDSFFHSPPGKWSPAQQTKHLITATRTAKMAFTLPVFIVRLVGGKANRNSRSYDELVSKYLQKLQQGGRASGRYIPKPIEASYGKEKLLTALTASALQFTAAINKNRTEMQLDKYIAPHPLLGKITLRELCYFTIYHTHHHLDNIKKMTAP